MKDTHSIIIKVSSGPFDFLPSDDDFLRIFVPMVEDEEEQKRKEELLNEDDDEEGEDE